MSLPLDAIDRYLAGLAHALDLPRASRRRVLREVETHLRETAQALRAEGLTQAEAARAAAERFGDVGEIAREIDHHRPPRRIGRRRLVAAALAVGLVATGAALAVRASPTPYAIVLSGRSSPPEPGGITGGAHAQLVRLDPHTLRPLPGPRLAVGPYQYPMSYDPANDRMALAKQRPDGTLRVVDLSGLRRIRDLRVASAPWQVRLAAWADPDHLVAIVQTMTGDYHQNVGQRRLVVLDARSGRVIAQRAYARHGDVRLLGTVDGRVILLWTPANEGGRMLRLDQVAADASLRSRQVDEGRGRGVKRWPGAVLDAAGKRVVVVVPTGRVLAVPLGAAPVEVHETPPLASHPGDYLRIDALSVDDQTVAVTGVAVDQRKPPRDRRVRQAGLRLLDTQSWQSRLVDSRVVAATVADGMVVAFSEPSGILGSPASGIGLIAYTPDGRRAWTAFPGRPVGAWPIGDVLVASGWGNSPSQIGAPFDEALLDPATGKQVGVFHVTYRKTARGGSPAVSPIPPTVPG